MRPSSGETGGDTGGEAGGEKLGDEGIVVALLGVAVVVEVVPSVAADEGSSVEAAVSLFALSSTSTLTGGTAASCDMASSGDEGLCGRVLDSMPVPMPMPEGCRGLLEYGYVVCPGRARPEERDVAE